MFVRTERLFLRPAWPEDLDELVQTLSDEKIEWRIGMAALPESPEAVRTYLERPRDPRLPHFFMYLRAPGGPQLVGGIGLGRHDGEVEVGYWIAAAHRGRGFAGEALRAIVDQARTLGHRRLVASHLADSPTTTRVLESAGFCDTGKVKSRYSATLRMEHTTRIFVAELDRRAAPRLVAESEALSA